MERIESSFFTILIPDKGYKLVNKNTGQTYQKIYLGVNDSIDNYTEEIDEKYVNMDYVVEVNEIKESMNLLAEQSDSTINLLLLTIDEMYRMLEPIFSCMPMELSVEQKQQINIFVSFYALLIQKGLKDLEEVPERFKEDVANLL